MKKIDDIQAAISVVIFDEQGRVLLQKRADANLWGIPSGHIEKGETIADAAIREVKEETNLEINIKKLIGIYSDPESQVFEYPTEKRFILLLHAF
ncbi:ADP-ribose pyrophosphatase YjhB (NUDIX family) [Cytobacillus purgationiresistens]|uniref:ADP-ribose pyrophosphatase YjhB (NUDIX family) n=1 Tax=Cytobacillus purgationiresistens TaxID=863449 RepID=A0ABU0ANG1_9BACI|nr:ADP-ribose pyrophosphatase YjhB (NUDIX family) [Cytobacillus purgationiresistens]